MTKFIEVHPNGTTMLLNLNYCEEIQRRFDGGAVIYLHGGGQCEPKESYDQVRKLIGSAQGGIPIGDVK